MAFMISFHECIYFQAGDAIYPLLCIKGSGTKTKQGLLYLFGYPLPYPLFTDFDKTQLVTKHYT